ncbi:unnamed protein product, partial [Aphanomyces euteiches]
MNKASKSFIISALVQPELWRTINVFQPGTYFANLSFLKVENVPLTPASLQHWLVPFQMKLNDYYTEYGTSQLQRLVERFPNMKLNLIVATIITNDVALLQVLHTKFDLLSCPNKLLKMACIFGSFEAQVYLHELGHPGSDRYAMTFAATIGALDIVKFLHDNRTEGYTGHALDQAASNGHLEVVRWLHSKEYPSAGEAMALAVQHGHMELVQWLHIHRDEVCRISLFHLSANQAKALEMVEWLCVNRCDVDPDEILHDAVLGNRLAIIELLVDRFGVPWSSRHIKTA